ncbi:MAG TPA: SIR2 family protein [Oligoflexus sp.]|uniref:SIR2 family protein n=1 Tax=Oligoflexus sp. TaxID=1971216 RepID=UPI002D665D6F|nr:SIR2 family protein [Oligoflexus sp.]HYX34444.1 SIR2 family protein [Oligoflexus sp.]
MTYSKDTFCRIFADEVLKGKSALFIGAGLSAAAGFVDWKGMMRGIADDLKLDIEKEHDLVAIAQYHVNSLNMDRSTLNEILVSEFIRDAQPTENHDLIASLPIETVWTTNYDHLIEKAFERCGKRIDRKYNREHFSRSVRGRDIVLFKMHGDAESPDDVVITKEDYESYELQREFFMRHLQGDLISKTFLFLGFNFMDPNIDYVLGRLRILFGDLKGPHFWIVKRPSPGRHKDEEWEYERRKFQYRIKDLERYGIHAVEIDDYAEITTILRTIQKYVATRSVFISTSASQYEPLGKEKVFQLAASLGEALIQNGYNLVSAMSPGIGDQVVTGAIRACLKSLGQKVEERILLRPFPPHDCSPDEVPATLTFYRRSLISTCSSTIFIAGNKQRSNRIMSAQGVHEEFALTKALGRIPIPLAVSGHAAKEIWDSVQERWDDWGLPPQVQALYQQLADSERNVDQWVQAILDILKAVNEPELAVLENERNQNRCGS